MRRKLVQRKDDTEEVVRKRFDEYEDKTAPVLGYYQSKRPGARRSNGVGTLDEVTERIDSAGASGSLQMSGASRADRA